MNLLALYCTHQTTPLAIRERLAFATDEQLSAAYAALRVRFPDTESVVLSTCNRVELYVARQANSEPLVPGQLAQFLSEFHHVPLDEFVGELRTATASEAVRHLYEVISSLDSMVLGEPQIVNQVRSAYRVAEENGSCGPITHALFQGAIRTSARVRTETRLAEGKVSIASVAIGDCAKNIFDRLDDKTVLVVGAGEMAEEALRYLKDEGVKEIVIINRSPERAAKLANEWGGKTAPWSHLHQWLGLADVIVSTTGSDKPIVDAETFKKTRAKARGKTVFILDLGAPRDFAVDVGELDDVFLYDIDSLKQTCDANRKLRVREIDKARTIVEDETSKSMAEFYRRASGEVVSRLMQDWRGVSRDELDRLFNKLPHLNEQDREQIERSIDRIVNKLLHPPLEALKDEARDGTPHGLIDALKKLFGLQD